MNTKIKTSVYAAKLRKRLKELEDRREKDLAAYKAEVPRWKGYLTAWVKKNAEARIKGVTVQEVKDHRRRNYGSSAFAPRGFFEGAPQPPVYPSDEPLRRIRNLLRQLGITGQTHVCVSTDDIAKYLGEAGEEES